MTACTWPFPIDPDCPECREWAEMYATNNRAAIEAAKSKQKKRSSSETASGPTQMPPTRP